MEGIEARINRLSLHHIGNPNKEGELILSERQVPISAEMEELLWKYLIEGFDESGYYVFAGESGNPALNNMYMLAGEIFKDPENFHLRGREMAEYLFDNTHRKSTKDGDLFLVYLRDLRIDEEVTDAIGIFKSERKEHYFLPINDEESIDLDIHMGIPIKKPNKGCIIYNTEKSEGYRVRVQIQGSNLNDIEYWRDDFLGVEAISDDYHHTDHYLKLTKNFVTQRLSEDDDVSRADQIDYLNKSIDYFKGKTQFENEDFTNTVFEKPEQREAFDDYKAIYAKEKKISIDNDFDINHSAVKKNQKIFKSVLKLDKNFHVYIHGDRSQIERGKDDDGRKYYKIFYREEA